MREKNGTSESPYCFFCSSVQALTLHFRSFLLCFAVPGILCLGEITLTCQRSRERKRERERGEEEREQLQERRDSVGSNVDGGPAIAAGLSVSQCGGSVISWRQRA